MANLFEQLQEVKPPVKKSVVEYTTPVEEKKDYTLTETIIAPVIAGNTFMNILSKNVHLNNESMYGSINPLSAEQKRNMINDISDPNVKEQVANLQHNINTEKDFYNTLTYANETKKATEILAQEYGTVGSVLAVGAASLVDIDAPLFLVPGAAPLSKGAKLIPMLQKAANNKVLQIGEQAVLGGGATLGSIGLFDKVTGNDSSQHYAEAFGLGAFLFGGLKAFDVLSTPSKAFKNADGTLTNKKAAEEEKFNALEQIDADISRLDEAIKVQNKIDETIAEHTKGLDKAKLQDEKIQQVVLQKTSEKLVKKVEEADKAVVGAEGRVTKVKENIATTDTLIKETNKSIKAVEKEKNKAQAEVDALKSKVAVNIEKEVKVVDKTTQAQLDSLLSEIQTAKSKLKDINSVHPGATSIIKQMTANNTALTNRIQAAESKIKEINKANSTTITPSRIQAYQEKLRKAVTTIQESSVKIDNLTKELEKHSKQSDLLKEELLKAKEVHTTSKKDRDVIKKTRDTFEKNWSKSKAPTRERTKYFLDKIRRAKESERILFSKQLLKEEEVKILTEGSNLTTIRSMYVSNFEKLSNELLSIQKAVDTSDLKALGAVIDKKWFDRFLISPIESLRSSPNEAVRGFSSLLSAGTVHRGKALTYTAENVQKELHNELHNKVHNGIRADFEQYKKDGFKGSFDEYDKLVGKELYKTIGMMQKEALKGIPNGLTPKKIKELVVERLEKLKGVYSTDIKPIISSIDRLFNYYSNTIHKRANSLGMVGFVHTSPVGYSPRYWSASKIIGVGRDNAITKVVEAQIKKANHMNIVITDELKNSFIEKATKAIDKAIAGKATIEAITEPFETIAHQKALSIDTLETGRTKSKAIDVFEDEIVDLIEDSAVGTSAVYGVGMHGRIALMERTGIEHAAQAEELFTKLNATPKEKDNMRIVMDTILGRREIDRTPFAIESQITRGLSSLSGFLHTGAFGVSTLTEITSVMKEFGIVPVLKSLTPSASELTSIYRSGNGSAKNQITAIASYGEGLFNHKVQRFETEGLLGTSGKLQDVLDNTNAKLAQYLGLLPLTDLLKLTVQATYTDWIAKLSVANNISPTDIKRLLDMGIGEKELNKIKEALKVDSEGTITNWDRTTWGEVDKILLYAGQTTIDRTILHPSGITLPAVMTNFNGNGGIIPRILMKFLRFPVESYERLLVRGIQEADAKQIIALAINIGMWHMILSAKDALKDEDKKKYTGLDGETKAIQDALINNSMTSFPFALANAVNGAVTGKTLQGYDASFGAVTSDWHNLVQQGNFNINVPFYKVNIDLKDATNNILSQFIHMQTLQEAIDE